MKTAIVYYSMEGNVDFTAKKIAEMTGGVLLRLKPKKEYPTGKVSKFIWGGKSAVSGDMPSLEDYEFDPEEFDTVILGTPIWAGTFAPPLRSFLRQKQLLNKKIGLFCCSAGSNPQKCFKNLEEEIDGTGNQILGTMNLMDPLFKKKEEHQAVIEEFCSKMMK